MKVKLKYYVPQVDERDCGVAALSMIMHQYKSQTSLASLRELAKTDLEGTSAMGIIHAAKGLGFETRAIRADMSMFQEKNIPLPFIAHVVKDGKFLHYYVVYGYDNKSIWLADPDRSIGKTKMSKQKFESEWSGVGIFIAPSPQYVPRKDSEEGIFSFFPIIFRQRSLVMLIVLAALLVTIISIVGSYYLQIVIDTYIPDGMKNTLGIVSVGLVFVYVFQQILSFGRDYLLVVLSQRLSIDVMLSYIRHLFELPMSFYSTRRTGEITSRFGDANSIIDALASTILTVFLDFGILVLVGSFLAFQNTKLFLITLLALPLYTIIVWVFKYPFKKMNNDMMQSNSVVSSSMIEDINGMETIKSLASEEEGYRKIDREFVDFLNKSFLYQRAKAMQSSIKGSVRLILNVVVLWVGSLLVIKNSISVGQLITYNALLVYFTDPLQSIIDLQIKLQSASVANNRLNEIYLVPSEFDEQENANTKLRNGDIVIRNLKFKYGFGKNAVDGISIKIDKGSKVALVGASGSGKSTLAKLLVRFLSPDSGTIFIDGQDSKYVNKLALRKLITYVPQFPFIFSGTIRENIMLGASSDVSNDDLVEALKIANIIDDIERLPQGLNSEISEEGGLSGGQKQRIAIARAVLTKAKILVFDESTSALDVLTERQVIDNLMKLNKTIIFVAHRLSIANKSEQIFIIEQGKIIENGSHNELIANKGAYWALVNH